MRSLNRTLMSDFATGLLLVVTSTSTSAFALSLPSSYISETKEEAVQMLQHQWEAKRSTGYAVTQEIFDNPEFKQDFPDSSAYEVKGQSLLNDFTATYPNLLPLDRSILKRFGINPGRPSLDIQIPNCIEEGASEDRRNICSGTKPYPADVVRPFEVLALPDGTDVFLGHIMDYLGLENGAKLTKYTQKFRIEVIFSEDLSDFKVNVFDRRDGSLQGKMAFFL